MPASLLCVAPDLRHAQNISVCLSPPVSCHQVLCTHSKHQPPAPSGAPGQHWFEDLVSQKLPTELWPPGAWRTVVECSHQGTLTFPTLIPEGPLWPTLSAQLPTPKSSPRTDPFPSLKLIIGGGGIALGIVCLSGFGIHTRKRLQCTCVCECVRPVGASGPAECFCSLS